MGRTTLGVQEINGRVMIDLPYVPINASIGCDLPWSIQTVEDNLVFANRNLTNLQVVDSTEYDDERVEGTRPQSRRVPAVFRRRPMCRRVLHFTMRLVNAKLNEDFELVVAQVFYNLQGKMR